MAAKRPRAPGAPGHYPALGLQPQRTDRRPGPAATAVPAPGAAVRRPAVAAQGPVCAPEQGAQGHRPFQTRQPVAHTAGDPGEHPPGDAGDPGPGPVRLRPADRRPWAERQPRRRAAADRPGLAGVLYRLSDPRPRRRGGTAFPLGKTPGGIPPGWVRRLGLVVLALVAVVAVAEHQPRPWPRTCWASPWC